MTRDNHRSQSIIYFNGVIKKKTKLNKNDEYYYQIKKKRY